MLILNQDRDNIIDTKNMCSISMTTDGKQLDAILFLNPDTTAKSICNMGTYFREARCKEVLEDIIKKAEVGCNTYIMPKE